MVKSSLRGLKAARRTPSRLENPVIATPDGDSMRPRDGTVEVIRKI